MNSIRKLEGPILASRKKTNYLVVFLHGWGSDGNDLIQIAHLWNNQLNDLTFLAPHGPEVCTGNPAGKQWFDILNNDESTIIEGLNKAYLDLMGYINFHLKKYQLSKNNFFLVGFSQGTMLSLYIALKEKFLGVVGYSGAFIGKVDTKPILKNDVLLLHGKNDQVVPIDRMYNALNILKPLVNTIDYEVYDNLEHSINEAGLKKGFEFIKSKV